MSRAADDDNAAGAAALAVAAASTPAAAADVNYTEMMGLEQLAGFVARQDMCKLAFVKVGLADLPTRLAAAEVTEDNHACLLLRNEVKPVLKLMLERMERSPVVIKGRLLYGAAGTGKSINVLLATELARANNFIVVYLMLGDLLEAVSDAGIDPARLVAERIFDYPGNGPLLAQLGLSLPEQPDAAFLGSMLESLRKQEQLPVLIALDQFNAVFNADVPEEVRPVFAVFKHPFQQSRKAFTIAAVSSLFGPVGKFDDADYQTLRHLVRPYTDEEWDAMIDLVISLKQLPADIDKAELRLRTGQTAHLLMQAVKAHKEERPVIQGMEAAARSSFGERVTVLVDKTPPGEDRLRVYDVLATMATRGHARGRVLYSAHCEISGLFKELSVVPSIWAPMCPAVLQAIVEKVSDRGTLARMIELLAADPGTCFHALELAVSFRFAEESCVALTATMLLSGLLGDKAAGDRHDYWDELMLHTRARYMQQKIYDVGGDHMTVGTAYVCAKGHPVCDMVVLTADHRLVFVQISECSYNSHRSKVSDLWQDPKTTMANSSVLPQKGDQGKSRLLEIYSDRLPPECRDLRKAIHDWLRHRSKRRQGSLPMGVFYLYISTADCTLHPDSKHFQDRGMVHVLSRATSPSEFQKLLSSNIGDFARFFATTTTTTTTLLLPHRTNAVVTHSGSPPAKRRRHVEEDGDKEEEGKKGDIDGASMDDHEDGGDT